MSDHLADPNARSWDDLKRDLEFTAAELTEIGTGARRLIAEARARNESLFERLAPHRTLELDVDEVVEYIRGGREDDR